MCMGTYHMQWKHIQYTSRTVARFATTHFLTDIRLVYTSNYEALNLTDFITFPKQFTETLLVYKIHKNKIYSQNPIQGHLSSIAVCNQQGFECHLNFCNTGEGISGTASILNMGTVISIFQYHTKIWNNQQKHCFLTNLLKQILQKYMCLWLPMFVLWHIFQRTIFIRNTVHHLIVCDQSPGTDATVKVQLGTWTNCSQFVLVILWLSEGPVKRKF
jgi:hypothetical protein